VSTHVEAIAEFAGETGAEVLRRALRYPSDRGGWQLSNIDFSEQLAKYRDHEVVIVIALAGPAGKVEREKNVWRGQASRCCQRGVSPRRCRSHICSAWLPLRSRRLSRPRRMGQQSFGAVREESPSIVAAGP
jgi:hypothetical protein